MAAPNPERELQRLQKLLQAGLPGCLLVLGASDFFRRQAFDAALAAVPEDSDLQSLDGQQPTDGQELEALCGANLFGQGSVLALRRGDAWLKKHGEAVQKLTGRLRPGCTLLLEIEKLDRRTRTAKALLRSAELFEFRDLYSEPYDRSRSPLDAEMVSWLVGRARQMGCPLTPEAAYLVMTAVGTRPGELLQEVERLVHQLAGSPARHSLAPEDLRGLLTCSFESTPFELADAILEQDQRRAMRALAAMFRRGVRSRDGARVDPGGLFPFITSWLYQSMAKLFEGRLLLDGGMPMPEILKALQVRTFVQRFEGQLRRNPRERLQLGLELLLRCQRELRSTGEDPQLLLERLLARYFAKAPGQEGVA